MFGEKIGKVRLPCHIDLFHLKKLVHFDIACQIETPRSVFPPSERVTQRRCPDGVGNDRRHGHRRHGTDPFRTEIDHLAVGGNGVDAAVIHREKRDLDPQPSHKRMLQNQLGPGTFADLKSLFLPLFFKSGRSFFHRCRFCHQTVLPRMALPCLVIHAL